MLSLVPKCSYKFFLTKMTRYLDPRYTIANGGHLGCNPFCRSIIRGFLSTIFEWSTESKNVISTYIFFSLGEKKQPCFTQNDTCMREKVVKSDKTRSSFFTHLCC